MNAFVEIDGSQGEGGGQVLRSALTLAILTQRPFRIHNIRANRSKPGLAAQHLTCVKAAAEICGATYKGAQLGSSSLYFEPGEVKTGDYQFRIGTAGATTLVLHTVYLPLLLRGTAPCTVTITGGTHVNHSPSYHFLESTWNGYLRLLGGRIDLSMTTPGFYPRGGGEIVATIHPMAEVRPLCLNRFEITSASLSAAVAGLPLEIARRMTKRLAFRLSQFGALEVVKHEHDWPGGPGCAVWVALRGPKVATVFAVPGERGKPAEAIADDCADEAIAFLKSDAPVDPHAADQIVLPLAFATGPSEYRVSEVTEHLRTNIAIIRMFVEREITLDSDKVEIV